MKLKKLSKFILAEDSYWIVIYFENLQPLPISLHYRKLESRKSLSARQSSYMMVLNRVVVVEDLEGLESNITRWLKSL